MRMLRHDLACIFIAAAATSAWAQTPAENVRSFAPSTPVRGQYIVVFKPHVPDASVETADIMRGVGAQGRVLHTYTAAIKGFAARLPDAAVQAVRSNPNVAYVEGDQTVQLSDTQSQATWGLDRVDQVDRPLDGLYQYNATGSGVTAFVIDTGIRPDHVEFTGRLGAGYTSINDGRGTNDCNGHGTHVAGTVGGTTWGVAKQATLVPVRVLDCNGSGTWSGVIAGVDWVANSTTRPAVANMSLGGGKSSSVNSAVAGAVDKGVTMAVAAGNSSADACNYSPASEPSAITVGATTSSDARASYSNYGACLDVFAPGSSITSAWHTGSTATNTISGTSMASPHVAGVAALVLQGNPTASPAAVTSFITGSASVNKVSSAGTGSPNLLLYSLADGTATEPAIATIAVRSLTGAGVKVSKNHWRARVTIEMRDVNTNAAMANVTVSGSFSPGGSASCVTASTGSCTVESGNFNNGTTATVYTVGSASGTNMIYDSSQNAETQERVTKP